VIDLATRRLVRRLEVGPQPHGIAAPSDGSVVFVSLEANGRERGEVLWIDPRDFEIEHRLAVGPEPHQIATTPDGRFVYVPCRDGTYWVVDARERRVVTRIETGGRPHNTSATSDGAWMLLSPMDASRGVSVVDVAGGHRVVGTIRFAGSVRPPALSADGRRLFQHVDGLNGFQVADVPSRRVIATTLHATPLGWLLVHPKLGWLGPRGLRRCHGLAISPDQREIWSVCGDAITVHAIDTPTLPERARIESEGKGYWITFSPDGRWALVALTDRNRVAMIDARRKTIEAVLEVGAGPKRNLVLDVQRGPSDAATSSPDRRQVNAPRAARARPRAARRRRAGTAAAPSAATRPACPRRRRRASGSR
jgi:DNA-binding beta-propeller fold protein YncE